MISFLSNWTEQITIAVIVVSIFELILPNGNIKKYIKVVLGIYIVFSIISPFVDSKALYDIENAKIDTFLDNLENTNQTKIDQKSMDARLEELYIKELEEDIGKKVNEFGYEIYKSNIDADFKNSSSNNGIHKINLILKENKKGINKVEEVNISIGQVKDVENETTQSKDIEDIRNSLAKYYEIDDSSITITIK